MGDVVIRIKEYMDSKNLSGTSFARELGMSSVSVNQYLSGKRKVSWEFISAILDYDDKLSAEWITRGRGEMYSSPTNSNESESKTLRELADAKMQLLVKEGVIKELKDVIIGRNGGEIPDERKSLVG